MLAPASGDEIRFVFDPASCKIGLTITWWPALLFWLNCDPDWRRSQSCLALELRFSNLVTRLGMSPLQLRKKVHTSVAVEYHAVVSDEVTARHDRQNARDMAFSIIDLCCARERRLLYCVLSGRHQYRPCVKIERNHKAERFALR